MLDDVSRRAGPYQGGTRYFSFDFKVFQETDVAVMVSSDGAAGETALVYGTDYSVELNADQDATPGGLVVLTSALESTKVLAIVSAIPYTQPTQLTNYSRFPPEILNKSLDRLEAQIQQLKEELSRAVTVDATDTMTPAELKQALLAVAITAKDFVAKAEEIYNGVKSMTENTVEIWEGIQRVQTEITQTVENAVSEIDLKLARNESIAQTCEGILVRFEAIGRDMERILPHVDDIAALRSHLDEVHRVGQDLLSTESGTLDLGSVLDEPDTVSTIQGGYVKKVAEHIDDCIHPVGENIEKVSAVAEIKDGIGVIAEDLQGRTTIQPTLDLGLVTEEPDGFEETSIEGGYLKKVAEHIDDCIHPVAEHLDEIATAPANAEVAEQAKRVATKAAEDAAAAASQSEEILNRLIENEGFDFERTFEEALAGGTSASSGSSLVATFEQALRA